MKPLGRIFKIWNYLISVPSKALLGSFNCMVRNLPLVRLCRMFEPCKKGNTFKNFKTRHFQTVFETKRKVNTIDHSNKEKWRKLLRKSCLQATTDTVKQVIKLNNWFNFHILFVKKEKLILQIACDKTIKAFLDFTWLSLTKHKLHKFRFL